MQARKRILFYYNSPLKTGETMRVKLRIPNRFGFVNEASLKFNRRGEPPGTEATCDLMFDENQSSTEMDSYSTFLGEIKFETPGYRTFYVKLIINGGEKTLKLDYSTGETILVDAQDGMYFWELFVYFSSFKTPDEVKGGIVYQIFVDTFCSRNLPQHLKGKVVSWNTYPKWQKDSDGVYRNNQFYGGNLRGIIEKLPYIKSLHVTMIYLTPIFSSPSSNRYDIADFMEIDEMVGTWDDLEELHKKANELGMMLVIDNVFNHASNENQLLKKDPEMFDWIQKYSIPKCWWGYLHLVEFNQSSPNYLLKLATFLMKYKGYADGIRLDVADNLWDLTLKFIRVIWDKYILGEVWKNAITGDYREFLYGEELDGIMNYQFPNAIYRWIRWGNYENFRRIVQGINNLYPKEALAVSPIFLSSHDIPRIPNILVGDFMKESPEYENVWDMEKDPYWYDGNEFNTERFRKWEVDNDKIPDEKLELARRLHKIAVFFQYFLPGLPSIFAGDEAGITGFKDPTNRKPFPWENIDEKLYKFYCEIGKFRITYRDIWAKSDFRIIECDSRKIIFARGKFKFIVNRTDHAIVIKKYNLEKSIFSLKPVTSKHVLQAYNAVVIRK